MSSASSSSSSKEPSPRPTYRIMAVLAIAFIALILLAIYSLSRLQTTPWTSPLRDLKIQSSLRKNLPQFEYKDGDIQITPQNFEGKWTLLSFWSYSCPPCLEELPSLNELAMTWSGPDLEVLTVNVDDDKDNNLELAKTFLLDEEIVLPTVFDSKKVLAKAFAVNEYPKHFLISPNKEIIWEASGAFEWHKPSARDQLLKLIEQQSPETDPESAE